MNKLYFFLCLSIFFQLSAQDSLAKYTAIELSNKSKIAAQIKEKPKLWKVYLDGMMRKNPKDSIKANTLYDVAWEVYKNQDYDLEMSIGMLKQGVEFAKRAHSKPLMLNCLESLSTFYALKNDNDRSLKSFEEMKNIFKSIPENSASYVTFQATTARVYSILGDFERSISIVKKSNIDINNYLSRHPKLPKDSLDELIWIEEGNYIHLAQSYNFQKQLDSAAFCIKKAKEFEKKRYNKKLQNNIWVQEAFYLILSKKYDDAIFIIKEAEEKGYIDSKNKRYRSLYYLAVSSFGKKEYAKSLSYCEQAIAIDVKIASFMNFELEIYNLAILNAQKIHDVKKENEYSKIYISTFQKYNYSEKARFISKLYGQDVLIAKQQLKSEKANKGIFILLLVILFLICVYLLWHYIRQKNDHKKFEIIISAFENNEIEKILQQTNEELVDSDIIQPSGMDSKVVKISLEVEERIVKQLERFENKEQFLSRNISLSNIASDFNTNSVYISAVIKKNKNKNFNTYINDLRIEYIIGKLQTSQEYLNYKIAYLAEECGFSSHTVFIRVFAEKTGLTPSKFIFFLKNKQPEL